MARIYKRTDRVTVKVDEITLKLAPLTVEQKIEIQQLMIDGVANKDVKKTSRGVELAMKYSLKGVSGIEDADGNPYKLEFNDDALTDSCIDDLMNLEVKEKIVLVCTSLLKGVPRGFTDEKGLPIEGVEIVKASKLEEKN